MPNAPWTGFLNFRAGVEPRQSIAATNGKKRHGIPGRFSPLYALCQPFHIPVSGNIAI